MLIPYLDASGKYKSEIIIIDVCPFPPERAYIDIKAEN